MSWEWYNFIVSDQKWFVNGYGWLIELFIFFYETNYYYKYGKYDAFMEVNL